MSGIFLDTQLKKLLDENITSDSGCETENVNTTFEKCPEKSKYGIVKNKKPFLLLKPGLSQKCIPKPPSMSTKGKLSKEDVLHMGKNELSKMKDQSGSIAHTQKNKLDYGKEIDFGNEDIGSVLANGCTSPNDDLEPLISSNDLPNPKNNEISEVFSDEEDNPNTVYYNLQKFKNHSRVSWISKVESMKLDDASKNSRRPIVKSLSYEWSGRDDDDDDDDDEIGNYSLLGNAKEMLDLRLATLRDMIKDEKSYADRLKKISGQSHLVTSDIPNIQKSLEPAMDVIGALLYLHKTFSNDMQKAIVADGQVVGDIIEKFVTEEFVQAKDYTTAYSSILSVVSKHQLPRNSSEVFLQKKREKLEQSSSLDQQSSEDTKQESFQSFLTSLSLPIWRFQNCIHSLERLIKFTSPIHEDYNHLQRALRMAKCFFTDFSASSSQNTGLRHLVKKGLVVEQVDEDRKLRYLFLFNDVIVCAKQKINDKFSVQWFIALCHLGIDDRFSALEDKHLANLYKDRTDSLKRNLVQYQAEYAKEFKKAQLIEKNFLQNMKLEMCKKKLMELEGELFLNTPYLKMSLTSSLLKKTFTVLLSSDYERAAWKNSIKSFIQKVQPKQAGGKMTLSQIHHLINDSKVSLPTPSRSIFQSCRIDGVLKLVIHKFLGLHASAKVFCTVEVDSFGHFFLMAKTKSVVALEPEWNEDFEIELEGSKTLRIMCYKIGDDMDSHLGSVALELNEAWLKGQFCEENVPISSNMFLKISVEYLSNEDLQILKEVLPSNGEYFGTPIDEVTRREETTVPLIITSCVEEIEKRGMKDVGLYRVSGLASEIQKLKVAFNKNSTSAITSLHRIDTNVLTGIVKLFIRELPDPLVPGLKYNEFVKCLLHAMSQDDNLAQQMISLPSPNLDTLIFLLNHIVKVSKEEVHNKMTLGNLATVFGPSLMKNPLTTKNASQEYVITSGTADVTHQCKITLKLLTMVADGYVFTRESQNDAGEII